MKLDTVCCASIRIAGPAAGPITGNPARRPQESTPFTAVDLQLANAQLAGSAADHVRAGAGVRATWMARVQADRDRRSVRTAAANANGDGPAVAPGGEMRQLFAELPGSTPSKSLFLYLSKDSRQHRCAAPSPIRRQGRDA